MLDAEDTKFHLALEERFLPVFQLNPRRARRGHPGRFAGVQVVKVRAGLEREFRWSHVTIRYETTGPAGVTHGKTRAEAWH